MISVVVGDSVVTVSWRSYGDLPFVGILTTATSGCFLLSSAVALFGSGAGSSSLALAFSGAGSVPVAFAF